MTYKTILATAFFAAFTASSAMAMDLTTGTELGTSMEQVQAKLKEMGYEVRKAEMEDGEIEAYVVKDGKMSEIYVNQQTGQVSKIKSK
ncbi:PepSY domain-containing protein [Hwanghaeella grinnelliae]|uniref:PepSY domain-containing protein n=1 Tax=Hwanghaeella grinnelliae TaxID=2500179 RepID=A0A3S2Z9T4_9PROT|nr:PepSY domain-containing protein [Hwanghaeella grinnelliae]RVU38808.1 PepSY domain-containing protein [Hwanghaeella grinnelliae]